MLDDVHAKGFIVRRKLRLGSNPSCPRSPRRAKSPRCRPRDVRRAVPPDETVSEPPAWIVVRSAIPWLRTTSTPLLETVVLLAVSPTRTVPTVRTRSVCEPPPMTVVPLATPVRVVEKPTAIVHPRPLLQITLSARAETYGQHRACERALVLTVNGKAATLVQDAEAYQELLDLAAEGIRQGLEDVANGRTRPARGARRHTCRI
jgi:hypothetical protein